MSKIFMLIGTGYDYHEVIAVFTDEKIARESLEKILAIKPQAVPGKVGRDWTEAEFIIAPRDWKYSINPHRGVYIEEWETADSLLEIVDRTDRRELCPNCTEFFGWVRDGEDMKECPNCLGDGRLPPSWWRKNEGIPAIDDG
jgi:hypothetical protein